MIGITLEQEDKSVAEDREQSLEKLRESLLNHFMRMFFEETNLEKSEGARRKIPMYEKKLPIAKGFNAILETVKGRSHEGYTKLDQQDPSREHRQVLLFALLCNKNLINFFQNNLSTFLDYLGSSCSTHLVFQDPFCSTSQYERCVGFVERRFRRRHCGEENLNSEPQRSR